MIIRTISQLLLLTRNGQVSFFLNDFENAMKASNQLDKQVAGDAAGISPNLTDLLSLVARQAMSALEITVSRKTDGNFDSSDIMAFMKDMGNVGGGGCVDSVYIFHRFKV